MATGLKKYCLVTVGATVGFKKLIKAVLQPAFWSYLAAHGFTNLRVQCGPDVAWATRLLESQRAEDARDLDIEVFDVRKNLMKEEMTFCQALTDSRQLGLVISHAGTGTILDAWKLSLPIIVVPNQDLLNDHQTEMADHLAKEGYATKAQPIVQDLQEAIRKSNLLWEESQARWPPARAGTSREEEEIGPVASARPEAAAARDSRDGRLSLWDLRPQKRAAYSGSNEVLREENVQMGYD